MLTGTSEIPHLCGIVPPRRDPQRNNHFGMMLFAIAADDGLWDNGTILNYSFFGGAPRQQRKVDEVIKEWTWYANITFQRVADDDSAATLRITFDPQGGSWSYVGRAAKTCIGPDPTINFGWVKDTDTITKKERGVILHEFGHVLGLVHEHESPARSGVIRLKEREIIQHYAETMDWDEATVREQVLDVYSEDSVSNYSQFDPSSIMIYSMPASMNEGGIEIYEVTELSMLDKAFVVANYPRTQAHERAPQWTPRFALTAAGASAHAVDAYLATSNVLEKRTIFTKDIRSLRALEAQRTQQREKPMVRRAPYVQRMIDLPVPPPPEVQDPTPIDQLAHLAAMVVAHPSFKLVVDTAVSATAEKRINRATDHTMDARDTAELQFRKRMEGAITKMWERAGPRASERILEKIECLWESSE